MLPLDDPRWKGLNGGYGVAFDASVLLARLERGEDVWDELWNELHHQGDVGEASYAAVPHLVRIFGASSSRGLNVYALVSTIEIERHRKSNPPIPDWLRADYHQALKDFLPVALSDLSRVEDVFTLRAIFGFVALAKGALKMGAWLAWADESEIEALVEDEFSWSELYR